MSFSDLTLEDTTVEELMSLLNEVTGRGALGFSVGMTYTPAHIFDSSGERNIDYKNWGFCVSGEILNMRVVAQGKTLEEALFRFIHKIPEKWKDRSKTYDDKAEYAVKQIDAFLNLKFPKEEM